MRAVDPALQAHLDGGATTLCACWRIGRTDGVALCFTDHDGPVAFEDMTFAPEAAVDPSALEAAAGLAADNIEILGALRSDAITADDVALGRYDGATVTRWLVNWRAPEQRLVVFRGVLGEITVADGAFRAEALGLAALLNRPIGRSFQPACDATPGDARCGVDAADPAFCAEGAVVEAAGATLIAAGLDGHAAGWFAGGALEWLDGGNAGLRARVLHDAASHGGRALRLWVEPGAAVAAGDRFRVIAGCDRTMACCRDKFRNLANFRGFPHMPGEDWLTAGPVEGAPMTGGSRHV
jgi:uncharacterized phage protein (TIGR02218 family)